MSDAVIIAMSTCHSVSLTLSRDMIEKQIIKIHSICVHFGKACELLLTIHITKIGALVLVNVLISLDGATKLQSV